ncbi:MULTISPECIES: hypothetical protein [unclassified Bradyrhizobium]|uniref:hypothetical protein n=1 Tax=unclassified Bradyrhizobium TaxID=2631580 RepID=UPI0033939B76
MPKPPPDFQLARINPRQPKHRLPPGPGRSKGSVNKVCRDLKLGIVDAAIALGEDGEGTGGLQGYLQYLGRNHVKSFAHLLSKVLPLTIGADNPSAVMVGTINVVSIPTGCNNDGSAMAVANPPIIEHPPSQDARSRRLAELRQLPLERLAELAGVDPADVVED